MLLSEILVKNSRFSYFNFLGNLILRLMIEYTNGDFCNKLSISRNSPISSVNICAYQMKQNITKTTITIYADRYLEK